jgi:hypothetical protein
LHRQLDHSGRRNSEDPFALDANDGRATGEVAEGRQHHLRLADPETRQPHRGAAPTRQAHCRMKVTGQAIATRLALPIARSLADPRRSRRRGIAVARHMAK